MRLTFRGIYFPQMGWRSWLKVIAQNRRTIFKLLKESVSAYRGARKKVRSRSNDIHVQMID